MTCWTSAFTSTMSPFLASFLSSLIRGFTSAMWLSWTICSAAAAADRDLDLLTRRVERAVIHFGDGCNILRRCKPDARVRLGRAAQRREVERRHAPIGIAVAHHQHLGDVALIRHRA